MARTTTTQAASANRPFAFIHIGDLHLTDLSGHAQPALIERQAQSRSDLKAILAQIAAITPSDGFDFVYLPGDLAENGLADEYAVLGAALAKHPDLKIRLIPGDHDRQFGCMADFEAFRRALTGAQKQPPPKDVVIADLPVAGQPGAPPRTVTQFFYEQEHSGVCCLFVDVISAGYGQKGVGLDFRVGTPVDGHVSQMEWMTKRVAAARQDEKPCAVFMHAYPADFRGDEEAAAVAGLFWNGDVRVVEMGHTHYNELAPDGRTLYAAVRSTGQNEDGPTGYAVSAIDGNATSWRFKQLQQTWPFVLITSPADRRLATEALVPDKDGNVIVRALVFSDQPSAKVRCHCRVDDGAWLPMTRGSHASVFELPVAWQDGSRTIEVKATDDREDGKDFVDVDKIEPAATAARFEPKKRRRLGSDAYALPSWPQKGIRGDQLGPNKHGRKW